MTTPTSAQRLDRLPPYAFAVIGERLRQMQLQGLDVIRLDIGSPDLPPADLVIDELARSARQPDHHGYSGYRGTPEIRQAVARYYASRFGVEIDPEREVLPLIGSKEGIVNLSLAYLDQGDLVLVPDISYPSYSMGARLAGADIHWLPMRVENKFLIDIDGIPPSVANAAKMIWVNYPNNPTGAIADMGFYRELVEFCRENEVLLASDNPYVDVTFDDYVAPSVLEVPGAKEWTIEFMSFSKTYNMAGWRLGAAVGSSAAIDTLLRVKTNVDSGHFRAIYDAGVAAIDKTSQAWIDERNRVYEKRRDRILQALPTIGLQAECPLATLYVWARVVDIDATDYVEQALRNAQVSLAPGLTYGPGGAGYVRISLSVPDVRLSMALSRLQDWYQSR